MMKCILGGAGFIAISFALSVTSFIHTPSVKLPGTTLPEDSLYNNYISMLYNEVDLSESGLTINVFEKAITGFYNLKKSGKVSSTKSILSIVDFDRNSTEKRLWIIDLDKKKLVLNTWVAHGQRSGTDKATRFSNNTDSFKSSLGFYLTGETYNGEHGRSLRLDGMDERYNSNARQRSIVVHGAGYVSQKTINALGRLGRSLGCPAVAPELTDSVINTIEGRTVLFINVSDQAYSSRYLDEHLAAMFAATNIENSGTSNQIDLQTTSK